MMDRSTLDGGNPRLPIYPLRVYRLEPNQSAIVRTLSARTYGLLTHWIKAAMPGRKSSGRSEYCKGESCPPSWHKEKAIWKGYISADVWDQERCLWLPVALELTENLELDMRDVYARGQVWQITKEPQQGNKAAKVTGCLLEELRPELVPTALDLVPCLKAFFHVEKIDLDTPNPLPARTLVSPHEGPPPQVLQHKQAEPVKPPTEEQLKRLKEYAAGRGYREGNGNRNGKSNVR